MTESGPATDAQLATTAIRLGWQLALAFHDPPPNEPSDESSSAGLPEHLPGASELSLYEQGQTLLAQVRCDIEGLRNALGLVHPSDDELSRLVTPEGDDGTRRSLLGTFISLRQGIVSHSAHLATALDLGRVLADTVLLVDVNKPETLTEQFDHFRLGNAYAWLENLHRLLSDHAADTVAGSLRRWEEWVEGCKGNVPAKVRKDFTRTLNHQGDLWRRLLCGETFAGDLLSAEDYKEAGDRVGKRFLAMLGGYVSTWRWVIGLFALFVAGVVALVVAAAPSGDSTIAALIATAAGSVGVSWKTVASTLGRATSRAEGPLWDAEVSEAMVIAATRLPPLAGVTSGASRSRTR